MQALDAGRGVHPGVQQRGVPGGERRVIRSFVGDGLELLAKGSLRERRSGEKGEQKSAVHAVSVERLRAGQSGTGRFAPRERRNVGIVPLRSG